MGIPRKQWLCYISGLPENNLKSSDYDAFVTYGDSQKTMALLHMGTPRKQWLCYIWGLAENNLTSSDYDAFVTYGDPQKTMADRLVVDNANKTLF